MKVGIMQPYFLPYIGYFQLINAVDKFVIYDDVNYIKGGWINRNNILIGGSKKLFTIKLKGASQNKLINEIEIGDDFRKFMNTIKLNYSKAPYFTDAFALLKRIISFEDKNLALFISNSISEIISYLKITTPVFISSLLPKESSLKGADKVVNICQLLEGRTYVNAIGGLELYDSEMFAFHGIELKFLKSGQIHYQQNDNRTVSGLSILDVLMYNPPETIMEMLNQYELI